MSVRAPKLSEVINVHIDRALRSFKSGMPGRIEKFNASEQTADVTPLLMETFELEDGTESTISFPVISSVPVRFAGGGGHALTFPVSKGDECWLSFSDRSLDTWFMKGGVVDPIDLRRHALSDAVATVDLRSKGNRLTEFDTTRAVLGRQGGKRIAVTSSVIHLGVDHNENATESAVKGDAQKSDLDTMLQSASQACTSGATACTTAASALLVVTTAVTAASAGLSVPPLTPVGVIFTTLNTGLVALTSQLGNLATQLTAIGTAFTTLKGQLSTHLSGIVKLK